MTGDGEIFAQFYKSYDFTREQARLLYWHELEKSLDKRGRKTDEQIKWTTDIKDQAKAVRRKRKARVGALKRSIEKLNDNSEVLYLFDELNECFLEVTKGSVGIPWSDIVKSIEVFIARETSQEAKIGRPKNVHVEAALNCYFLYRKMNDFSLTATVKEDGSSDAVNGAIEFFKDVDSAVVLSKDAASQAIRIYNSKNRT